MSEHNGNGTAEAKAWKDHALVLAKLTDTILINRRDAIGSYTASGSPKCERGLDTLKALEEHFAGKTTRGAYAAADVVEGQPASRFVVADVDAHSEKDDPEINLAAALAWREKAWAAGLVAILIDSNGAGGYHLWIIFSEPIPHATAWTIGKWLVSDWADRGFTSQPETFPKSAKLSGPKRIGNFVRLPGKHHKRAHWSKIHDGGRWLAGEEAVSFLLKMPINDPADIPTEAKKFPKKPNSVKRESARSSGLRVVCRLAMAWWHCPTRPRRLRRRRKGRATKRCFPRP